MCQEDISVKCQVEVYRPSIRPYKGLPDIDYPFHDLRFRMP